MTAYPDRVAVFRGLHESGCFVMAYPWDVGSARALSSSAVRRSPVRARGHFPTDQAALKCLYLATRSLDPTGRGRARWVIRWKDALNAFAITFEGLINPSNT